MRSFDRFDQFLSFPGTACGTPCHSLPPLWAPLEGDTAAGCSASSWAASQPPGPKRCKTKGKETTNKVRCGVFDSNESEAQQLNNSRSSKFPYQSCIILTIFAKAPSCFTSPLLCTARPRPRLRTFLIQRQQMDQPGRRLGTTLQTNSCCHVACLGANSGLWLKIMGYTRLYWIWFNKMVWGMWTICSGCGHETEAHCGVGDNFNIICLGLNFLWPSCFHSSLPPQCGFFNTFELSSIHSALSDCFALSRQAFLIECLDSSTKWKIQVLLLLRRSTHTPGQRAGFSSNFRPWPQVHHVSSTFLDASSASDPYLALRNLRKSGHSKILCCHFKKWSFFRYHQFASKSRSLWPTGVVSLHTQSFPCWERGSTILQTRSSKISRISSGFESPPWLQQLMGEYQRNIISKYVL